MLPNIHLKSVNKKTQKTYSLNKKLNLKPLLIYKNNLKSKQRKPLPFLYNKKT